MSSEPDAVCPRCKTPLSRWRDDRYRDRAYCPDCGYVPGQWGCWGGANE